MTLGKLSDLRISSPQNGGFSTPKCTYIIDSGCVWISFWVYNHQRCQVPKMEVLTYVSCMSGLCKGKPIPKIAENKVQYLHFRHLKFLVIQLLKHPPRSPRCTKIPWKIPWGDAGHGFLDTILGPGYKRNAQGLVVSKCGAPAQRWHVDSSHLFATPTLPNLPCHFVTVFCPLYQAHKAQTFVFLGGNIRSLGAVVQNTWKNKGIHLLRQADKEDRGKVGMLVIMIYYCKWISLPLYLKSTQYVYVYKNRMILLMEETLHQLISTLSHYLKGFIHSRSCRISSINSRNNSNPWYILGAVLSH